MNRKYLECSKENLRGYTRAKRSRLALRKKRERESILAAERRRALGTNYYAKSTTSGSHAGSQSACAYACLLPLLLPQTPSPLAPLPPPPSSTSLDMQIRQLCHRGHHHHGVRMEEKVPSKEKREGDDMPNCVLSFLY